MFSPIAAMTRPAAAPTPATTSATKIILCRLRFIAAFREALFPRERAAHAAMPDRGATRLNASTTNTTAYDHQT